MTEPILLSGLIGRSDWNDLAWEAFPARRPHSLALSYRRRRAGSRTPALRAGRRQCRSTSICGWEHILILSGAQSDGQRRHTEGTLMISPPETRHAIQSDDGCVALAIWQRQVRLVKE